MNKFIVILILVSFVVPVPVHAGLETDFDPVEKPLIEKQKQMEKQRLEDEMSREFKKKQAEETEKRRLEEQMTDDFQKKQAEDAKKPVAEEQAAAAKQVEKSGSTWWKWALGILVVGGIAAAAGGGGGGGGGSSPPPAVGDVTVNW